MGRFDFNSDCLSQHNIRLHIETDNHPCDGHSNLLGWNEDTLRGKAENEEISRQLKDKCATFITASNKRQSP